jgi:sarcosine oxidase gamma subunit
MTTFGIVHRFPGGTREQYEKVLEVVHPDGGKALPEGQLLHLAGSTPDGWLVMAVHESRESWERFRDDTLMPGLAGVDDGLPGPPEEMTFDVQVFQTRHRSA